MSKELHIIGLKFLNRSSPIGIVFLRFRLVRSDVFGWEVGKILVQNFGKSRIESVSICYTIGRWRNRVGSASAYESKGRRFEFRHVQYINVYWSFKFEFSED
jgi:hypothetical protein